MCLGWRGEVPTSWWPMAEDKLADVLGQRWRTRRGQRQKGGIVLMLDGEVESELLDTWFRSALRKDRFAKSAQLCPCWQAGEAQIPPHRFAVRGAQKTQEHI